MISSLEKQRSLQHWNLMLKEAQISNNYKSSLKKNVTNVIKTTVLWNTNTTNSRNHFNNPNQKTRPRGAKEALQTKRRHPHPRLEKLNHNTAGLPQNVERNNKALDNLTSKNEQPTIPPTSSQTNTEDAPCGAGAHDHN